MIRAAQILFFLLLVGYSAVSFIGQISARDECRTRGGEPVNTWMYGTVCLKAEAVLK